MNILKYICLFLLYIVFVHTPATTQTKQDTSSLIQAWKLHGDFITKKPVDIDTLMTNFQTYNPVFKKSFSNSYLGNLGLPAQSNIFIYRDYHSNFFMKNFLENYMHLPEKNTYYNTRKPFTNITYSMGGPSDEQEQYMKVIHSQNISPDFNAAINYNLYSSVGQYASQNSSNHSFSFVSNYRKNRYSAHGSFSVNSFTYAENGGILNDEDLEDTEVTFIPVKLENANTKFHNLSVFLSQGFDFYGRQAHVIEPDTLKKKPVKTHSTIYHTFKYDRNYRLFIDNLAQAHGSGLISDKNFYENFYIDSTRTNDSTYYRRFFNSIQYVIHEDTERWLSSGLRLELSNELVLSGFDESTLYRIHSGFSTLPLFPYYFDTPGNVNYYRINATVRNLDGPIEYLHAEPKNNYILNTIVSASLFNRLGRIINYDFSGALFLTGYNIGDYRLKARISKKFNFFGETTFAAQGEGLATRPDKLYEYFFSNHFIWDFRETGGLKQEFYNSLKAEVFIPEFKFHTSANYSLITNYLYFNEDAMPEQYELTFSVISILLNKNFELWKFRLNNKLAYQYSTNKRVLQLPEFAIYHSTFFEQSIVRNVLQAQIGFDVHYHTKYYANSYMPATGQFHVQNSKLIGDYPFVSAFINLKLKRTRFLFKYENVNLGILPADYFTTLHHPMVNDMFIFGLSWSFYD